MRKGILFTALILTASGALAVDTWEPYPMGAGAVEFYLTRRGSGLEGPAGHASSLVLGPSWGIHETTHLSLYTGITHPDKGEGGLDFLSLGIFRNFFGGFEKPFKLDAYFSMTAFGPGLGMSSSLTGLEANLDFEKLGLYARPALTWFHDENGDRDSALSIASGAWYQLGTKVQLLAEATFAESEDNLEHESTAAGINILLTQEVELILELRSFEPPEGADRAYDITVGAVTVW